MEQEWPDLTEVEVRATALDRLDLHYEHRDALTVERGTWLLADHLRRFTRLQVVIGEHVITGDLQAAGADWVQLGGGLVRLSACDEIRPLGRGQAFEPSPLEFRQCVRQYAGRVPRELILTRGSSTTVMIDWVAADFLHARSAGRPCLLPLGQVAAVLGAV
jgi:hypothetical protein